VEAEQVTFLIRAAVPADTTTLQDVYRPVSNVQRRRLGRSARPSQVLEFPDLAVRQERTRVAVTRESVVGFASWLSAADVFEIEDLLVDPDRMR
jgi:hypothetical protein